GPPLERALHAAVRIVVVVRAAALRVTAQTVDERGLLAHRERLSHPAQAHAETLLPLVDEIAPAPALDRDPVAEVDLHETPGAAAVATRLLADAQVDVPPVATGLVERN